MKWDKLPLSLLPISITAVTLIPSTLNGISLFKLFVDDIFSPSRSLINDGIRHPELRALPIGLVPSRNVTGMEFSYYQAPMVASTGAEELRLAGDKESVAETGSSRTMTTEGRTRKPPDSPRSRAFELCCMLGAMSQDRASQRSLPRSDMTNITLSSVEPARQPHWDPATNHSFEDEFWRSHNHDPDNGRARGILGGWTYGYLNPVWIWNWIWHRG